MLADKLGQLHERHDMFNQPTVISVVVLDSGGGLFEPRHKRFVGQKTIGEVAQVRIFDRAQHFGQSPSQFLDTDLRDQILVTLNDELRNGNQSPKFRYQAIEALEPMLPDPTVEEWLNYLAENDPEPKLQARAGRPSNSSK